MCVGAQWGVHRGARGEPINSKWCPPPTLPANKHCLHTSQIKRSVSLQLLEADGSVCECTHTHRFVHARFHPPLSKRSYDVNMKFKRSTSLARHWQPNVSVVQWVFGQRTMSEWVQSFAGSRTRAYKHPKKQPNTCMYWMNNECSNIDCANTRRYKGTNKQLLFWDTGDCPEWCLGGTRGPMCNAITALVSFCLMK